MSAHAASVVAERLMSRSGDLLGAPPRVYPLVAPQSALHPYVVYGRVAAHPEYHMRGEGGLGRSVVQIEAWADTYAQILAVDELLRLALSGFRGSVLVGEVTWNVRRMHFISESEDTVEPRAGSGSPIYHLSKELECDVFQSIPIH